MQRSYWCGASTTEDDSRGFGSESSENEYFEEEPDGLKPGITIKKLRYYCLLDVAVIELMSKRYWNFFVRRDR